MKIFTSNFIYLLVICRERLALYNFPAGENVCKLFWLTPSTKLSQAKYTTGPNIINHFFFLIQKTNLKHNQSKYTKYKPHHPFMYTTASSVKKKKKKKLYIYRHTHTRRPQNPSQAKIYSPNYPIIIHQFSPVNHTMHKNPQPSQI